MNCFLLYLCARIFHIFVSQRLMSITFVDIIDYLGTFAFAISGVRLASAKQFDWFGAFIVDLATAFAPDLWVVRMMSC